MGASAWVACKEQSRVIRLNTRTGKITASIRVGAPVIAVAGGYGSIWALDTGSTLFEDQTIDRPSDQTHCVGGRCAVQRLDRWRFDLGRRRPGRPA